MGEEKTVTYAIIAACIIGIVVVAVLVLTYTSTSENFSELYFEDHTELPRMAAVGEEEEFAFTIVSHETDVTSYNYTVSFDDEAFEMGSFVLGPWEDMTINVSLVCSNSSIVLFDNYTNTETSYLDDRKPFDLLISAISTIGNQVKIISSKDKYTIVYSGDNTSDYQSTTDLDNKIVLPMKFPITGLTDPISVLIFDPLTEETFATEYETRRRIGNPNDIKIDNLTSISSLGYDTYKEEWTIYNNYGSITIAKKVTKSQYRYEFKKVSVQVTSGKDEYEIHFWMIITCPNPELSQHH
jgi:hypothetical protein